jgi:hypothetical protein
MRSLHNIGLADWEDLYKDIGLANKGALGIGGM